MISLNKSCFTNYSIDLSGLNIIMRIKRNIKVLDIDIITFITSNESELIFHDILYTLELSYFLLSLNRLMMIDNTILFNDSYYIIKNNIRFHIKSKFELFFDIINILFHFYIDFLVTESNLTNFKSIKFNLINFKLAIIENQIAL